MNQLTKQSSESEIKAYFDGIAKFMRVMSSFRLTWKMFGNWYIPPRARQYRR